MGSRSSNVVIVIHIEVRRYQDQTRTQCARSHHPYARTALVNVIAYGVKVMRRSSMTIYNIYLLQISTHHGTNKTTKHTLLQFCHLILQHQLKAKRLERQTITNKMLGHGFDPVQAQRVQHGARTLHDDQHCDGKEEPYGEEYKDGEDAEGTFHGESVGEGHAPKHDGELLMGEGEGPQTEVGCGVGDAVKAEFYRED